MVAADRSTVSGQGEPELLVPVGRIIGALLVLFVTLTACSDDPSARAASKATLGTQAVPVSVRRAVAKSVPVQVLANGTAQSMAAVTINSQVDGEVSGIHFTEGQDVQKGDLLFTLDQRPFQAAVRQAQATLARDSAQLQQAEAALTQARAAERQTEANERRDMAQLDNATAETRRYKSLIDDGAISREQYDQVRTAELAMEATVEADRAAITNAKAAIEAAQAAVENARGAIQVDQAVVENARIQLGYTTIDAPMTGRTGSLLVHIGSAVKARDAASPLVVINQVRPIYVSFSIREQDLAAIRTYRQAGSLQAQAFIPGQETMPVYGELAFINNTVDPATGTIQLKATFPNTDNRLWPGQFVNVALTLVTMPSAVVVPTQAIQTGQQGSYVFVVQTDNTVRSRSVAPGRTVDNETVVEKGVVPGDLVVTEGQIRLVPGAKVDIKPSEPQEKTG